MGRALDLGTGCGVQALHLSTHAAHVVATDVNARALAITAFNAALNEVEVDVRDGSLWEPVAGETFDLVTTNPPFVISPATDRAAAGWSTATPGSPATRSSRPSSAARPPTWPTAAGATSWPTGRSGHGQPWADRVADWLPDDCDALVVQREVLDPPAYVELWLKDAGRHGTAGYLEAYDAWLRLVRRAGHRGGRLRLAQPAQGRDTPARRARELLDHPYAVEQPIAAAVEAWGARPAPRGRRATPGCCSGSTSCRRPTATPGAEDPETIVLRQRRGLCRARQVDTVEAALAGASDGELTVGPDPRRPRAAARSRPRRARRDVPPGGRGLVREGFLAPA